MIKGRRGNLLVFGLSAENMKRLQEDDPIYFGCDELGMPGFEVLIFYGPSEAAMAKILEERLGFKTPVPPEFKPQ